MQANIKTITINDEKYVKASEAIQEIVEFTALAMALAGFN